MFYPLWRRLSGRSATKTKNLYDLTEGQVQQLALLTKQPGWEVYMHLLDQHSSTVAEELLNGGYETLLETRGVIKGYREAALIVVNILQEKEQRDVRERSELAAAADRERRVQLSTRYSPFADGTR